MTAICIASGASLTQSDVDFCRGKGTVYAVNDVYKLAPWADYFYAADADWWEWHIDNIIPLKGQKYTLSEQIALDNGFNYIDYDTSLIWSTDPSVIATGGNSGFQALNLAALHGHKTIVLLGYDMGFTGQKHFFGDHPAKINRNSRYDDWIKHFNKAAPLIDARVVNCTRQTALECFKKADLCDVLQS